MKTLQCLKYAFYVIFHPFDGFWDLKHEKRGNLAAANIILVMLMLTLVLQRQLTAFIFNNNRVEELNLLPICGGVLLVVLLWCISNWSLTSLMDGEGTFKEIYITTCYSLVPLILIYLPLIPFSHILTAEDSHFYVFFMGLASVWTGFLMICGTMVLHQYSLSKTIVTTICILLGMCIIVFIGLLCFSLIQQMAAFVDTIYKELYLRIG